MPKTMFEQVVDTSTTPRIIVECRGDLALRGKEGSQVVVRAEGGADDLTVQQDGETVTVAAQFDCYLTCPPDSTILIETVQGDLAARKVKGEITGGAVGGDVLLRSTGPVSLEKVGGDLSGRRIGGDLRAGFLGEDGWVEGVAGRLSLSRVGGGLRIGGIEGGVEAAAGEDVILAPPFTPGAIYSVDCGGDLRLLIPPDGDLTISIHAGGIVRSSLPDISLEEGVGEAEVTLGTGEARVEVRAGGDVRLQAAREREEFRFDVAGWGDALGVAIEARIAEVMGEVERRLQESLGRIDEQAIRQRVERVRRKAERAAERARLRAEGAERRWRRASGRPPSRRQVTDEERLRVLRLVETGRITPEEAGELLAALEGR